MTDRYVYSGAAGAGTGVDWANAFTTLSAAFAAGAAGDRFFVAHDHATSTGSAITLTAPGSPANMCQVLCVNRAGSVPPVATDLRTTATITATGANSITVAGSGYFYGITFTGGSGAVNNGVVTGGSGLLLIFDNCKIVKGGTTASGTTGLDFNASAGGGKTILINTSIQFGATGDSIRARGLFEWRNTAAPIAGATMPNELFAAGQINSWVLLDGLDLSAYTGTLFSDMNGFRRAILKDCKISSSATIVETMTTPGVQEVFLIRTDSAGTNYRNEKHTLYGTQTVELTRIRSGGANDGATPIAWKLTTSASAKFLGPLEAMPIVARNDSTGQLLTVTIYGIIDAAALPKNDELWSIVEYLSDSGSPRGAVVSSAKATVLTTAADQPASTKAWDAGATARSEDGTSYSLGDVIKVASNPGRLFFCTTAGVSDPNSEPAGYTTAVDGGSVTDGSAVFRAGMRFALQVQFTPQQKGLITTRVCAGKASTTYYVDPKPDVVAA